MKQIGIYLLLLFGLSFHFGRLFEIFSWNTNIIRIESISHFSHPDVSDSYKYSKLNDQYWEEKALEDSKIRIDFSERYLYLNNESERLIIIQNNQFDQYKTRLKQKFILSVLYPDDYLF